MDFATSQVGVANPDEIVYNGFKVIKERGEANDTDCATKRGRRHTRQCESQGSKRDIRDTNKMA